MRLLYNFLIYITTIALPIVAVFNDKLKRGIVGRSETFSKLTHNISDDDKVIWFHCASLGEYEQGLPVFEVLRNDYPNHKIVLSFFSPSGYEIRKNSPIADIVVYLPFDTASNAKRFINLMHPELVVFVKYEIWPNYLNQLYKQQIKTILISALFNRNELYFKWYGTFMKNALRGFSYIFTQDENSKDLLNSIEFNNVAISGDTRFDRVSNQLKENNNLSFVEAFKQNKLCIVCGSTWPEDEQLLIHYINNDIVENVKVIIAPHNIKANQITKLKQYITKSVVLYSESEGKNLSQFEVLILDTIGLLSKTYSYADIAYVGGAMGSTGLHNTLEPAVFGIPIIIGKNFEGFPEAKAMISKKGMVSISNSNTLGSILNQCIGDEEFRKSMGEINSTYIKENRGAVIQILDYIRK